jgi:hypothetical protein
MHWLSWVSITCVFIGCGSALPSPLPGSSMTLEEKDGESAFHNHQAGETISSMSSSHAHLGPHFRWTAKRPPQIEDKQKAEAIVQELRRVLARYRDYRMAIEDGFEPFLPNVPQHHYQANGAGSRLPFALILPNLPRYSIAKLQVAMSWKERCIPPLSGQMKMT